MSRPLNLEVPAGQGNQDQRYSFMATPVEMHPSSHQIYTSSPIPAQQPVYEQHNTQQTNQHTHQVHINQYEYQAPFQDQHIPSEKERLRREGIISSYSEYPSPDQHPANYAPFADQADNIHPITHSTAQPPYYSNDAVSPPTSPGPLPVKINPEPSQNDTITVAPDANPLQSPKIPYFPPPSAAKHGPLEDLGSFHQPGQILHPNQEVQGGAWYNELCDCSNIGICCLGLSCPCILYGRTQYRLSMRSRKEDPTNLLGYETCSGSCTGMALLCGCQWLLATIQHTRIRKAYGIHGSVASDCVRATCCTCCTLIQDEKEIVNREQKRSRVAVERGATLISPYTAPGPMTFAPPPKP